MIGKKQYFKSQKLFSMDKVGGFTLEVKFARVRNTFVKLRKSSEKPAHNTYSLNEFCFGGF